MKVRILVILAVWGWCFWVYKNQSWVVTPNEARLMYETGVKDLRFVNFGLIALAISLFYLKTKSILATIFLALTPWWFRFGVFDRQIALIVLLNMLAWLLVKNKFWLVAILIFINLLPIYKADSWFWKDESLNIKTAQTQTIIRFESETQINNGREILPAKFKKIAYNKYFYLIRHATVKLAKTLDWENISSPSQKGVTVGNNPYDFKGLSMVVLPILMLGLLGISKEMIILGLLALIAGFMGRTDDALVNTMLLTPILAIGAANLSNRSPKLLKILIFLWVILASKDLWRQFLYHEQQWNQNKSRTMVMLAEAAVNTPGKLVVSEMLGSTRWYYYYKYGKDDRISFKQFNLKEEKRMDEYTYIGLPGEFVGNKAWEGKNNFDIKEAKQGIKIVNTILLIDTVSYGNGDQIWVGK